LDRKKESGVKLQPKPIKTSSYGSVGREGSIKKKETQKRKRVKVPDLP